jgi:uncharacterized protein (DUF427 family)
MKPVLEDRFIGPGASPSFSQGQQFRWEDSNRRVRVIFGGVTIADSKHVMLLHEFGRLPVFYFPVQDVRQDALEATDYHTSSPLKGEAPYWTIRVDDRVAERAAWSYLNPLPDGPQVKGYMAFYWDEMDAWFEEDEQVFAHARDPYKRVDILPSSRHVRVVLGGVTIAETRHPVCYSRRAFQRAITFLSKMLIWSFWSHPIPSLVVPTKAKRPIYQPEPARGYSRILCGGTVNHYPPARRLLDCLAFSMSESMRSM